MESSKRERPVRKMVSFSEAEWSDVQARMRISSDSSFDGFARRTCLRSEVKVVRQSFDPQALRADLARIGNNVNQIARMANVEQASTAAELRQVREMLREVQAVILAEFRKGA